MTQLGDPAVAATAAGAASTASGIGGCTIRSVVDGTMHAMVSK